MNIGQDIERMVNKEVERRLTEYQRVVALLVEQAGGEVRLSQEDMTIPAGAFTLKTFIDQDKDNGDQVVIQARITR